MTDSQAHWFVREDAESTARALAKEWVRRAGVAASNGLPFRIALPGGSTPRRLMEVVAQTENAKAIDWSRVHLFWGDERCVPPDHAESNYRMAKDALLDRIPIPSANIHRIRGEDDPHKEAVRYAEELRRVFDVSADAVPRFDWILLGMGADGHTASLFPGQTDVLECRDLCAVARQPKNGQARITLTFPVLNAALCVSFLVTGAGKAERLVAVRRAPDRKQRYPASRVEAERIEWWVDKAAASRPE
ncbi:6-phosphogluconolactonase [Nitrospina gracilis]|uniref:6-phosphogluconolactonase n=1 Tax=Nitrospina gracilis TaxID=35801 RepID=UPI001F0300E7|nr:6-phosphogluconolactonase [Nitrospina gracilis]MCF8719834.1 6-phosphogluconolactonase [Nitrospina gracilis Nb-211]